MSNEVVESTAMDDSKFEDLIRLYEIFSRWAALLPFKNRDFNFIGTRILTVFGIANMIFSMAMLVGYDIDVLINGTALIVEDIYITMLATASEVRYYLLVWFRKDNATLFEECSQLWELCNAKGRATVKRYENKIRLIYKIYVSSIFMANILMPISAYMTRLPPSEPNGTEQRVLPFRWFMENEPYQFLGYHATFIIQTINIQTCLLLSVACDGTIPGFLMLAAGFFEQLTDRLADCAEADPLTMKAEVIRCIKFHQKLLKFCDRVNNISQLILLNEIIVVCYSVSLVLIKLTGNDADKYSHVPIIGVVMSQLFLIHWTPDLLADQSEDVAFAVYSVLMKRLDDKKQVKDLHVMLTRAQTPVMITAGNFVILSLENYASMLNGAYSFFMVLRSFDIQ